MDIRFGLVGMALVAGVLTAPIMAFGGFVGTADPMSGAGEPPPVVVVASRSSSSMSTPAPQLPVLLSSR